MNSNDYNKKRDKILQLRDEGKFIQAIEAADHFCLELYQDLSQTDIESTKSLIKEFLMSTYYVEGAMLRQVRNYFQSDIILHKGLAIAEETKDIQLIAKIYSALANNKYQNGYLEQTLELLQKGYEVIKDSTFYVEKVMIQGNIGQTLNTLGEFDAAEHIISTMVGEIEKLEMLDYIGNAYFSLGEFKYNQSLYKDAFYWFQESIKKFTIMNRLRNLYYSTLYLIKTYIQLGDIDTAEKTIEELTKIEYEGKGDKEEIEKLLLFVSIFIAKKEYTIAKFSLETIMTSLDSIEMIEYKALCLFQRASIHCLEEEYEQAVELVEKIVDLLKDKQNIVFFSQLNYLKAWAFLKLVKTQEAKDVVQLSFLRTKGRLLLSGMFYVPKEVVVFFRKEQVTYKEKQQS